MKKIKLSQEKYAIIDDEDYHYLSRFNWQYCCVDGIESVRRTFSCKFGDTHINLEDYIVSRPVGGAKKQIFKNNNRLDFRKNNIDFIGISGVKQRAVKQKATSSVYKGVTKNNGRGKDWRGQIEKGVRGTKEYKRLCFFSNSEIECAKWYNEKAKELFGKYAYQNIIK